jgi:hypothetical protein
VPPLTLSAAVWLWSGLALAVPVVLHLLGKGRGVRRRWPSVVLLREAALASGARLKPSQPWLLLLRCALLAAVTLALAEPAAARRARAGMVRLVEPGLGLGASGGAADSSGGAEVRLLAPELPVAGPADLAASTIASPGRAAPDLWSLLAEADAELPAGMSFEVVARPRLAALRGQRPHLGRTVVWRLPPAGAVAGRGAPGPGGAAGLGGVAGRGQRVRLWIEAAPERAGDAATLRNGLTQGAAALGWTLAEAPDAATADFLASLGREAPAGWAAALERGATLLRDGGAELAPCVSLVGTEDGAVFESTLCGGEPAGQPLWRDGAGRTVLARESRARRDGGGASAVPAAGAVLRFAGRFSPAAGVWGRGAFAALLRAARTPAAVPGEVPPEAAGAEASIAQALPERGAARAGAGNLRALAAPLWLLAGCLFAAERWLAARSVRSAPLEER